MTPVRATALLTLALALPAAAPVGFTGVWKLNLQKSRMRDGQPVPFNKSHIISIVQKGTIIYWREQRITSEDILLSNCAEIGIGGQESVLFGFDDGRVSNNSRISIVIDGKRLEQKFRGTTNLGKTFQGIRKLLLADDGKSMSAVFEANRFGELVAWTEVWDRF